MNDFEERLKKNIACRKSIEELMELITEEGEKHGKKFYEDLAKSIILAFNPKPAEKKQAKEKMTERQAKVFGRKAVPFGEYKGEVVDDVPIERLCWYADQRFVDDVRLYLRSDRIQKELKEK